MSFRTFFPALACAAILITLTGCRLSKSPPNARELPASWLTLSPNDGRWKRVTVGIREQCVLVKQQLADERALPAYTFYGGFSDQMLAAIKEFNEAADADFMSGGGVRYY